MLFSPGHTRASAFLRSLLAQVDIEVNGRRPWDIRVHNDALYARVLRGGSLGLGDAYVDGWWDCDALDEFFFRILRARLDEHVSLSLREGLFILRNRFFNLQTLRGSKKVAREHYDLGNDLFFSFLDPWHQYSCAYFREGDDLASAQERKMDLICRKLQLKEGERVLDIGCGWGGLARFMAERHGCSVTGITISREQVSFAREFCKGLPIEILPLDYREITGTFDKVVSVGMFEHVGEKNYRTFMRVAHRRLKDDGLFLLHTIGQSRADAKPDAWMLRYIFPHSMVPSPAHIARAIDGLFAIEDWHNFGASYDKTLMAWRANFQRNWSSLKGKYGDTFFRLWTYYLSCVAGSFRARSSQLWQIVLSKEGVLGGYSSVR